jgi:hypothetical protein
VSSVAPRAALANAFAIAAPFPAVLNGPSGSVAAAPLPSARTAKFLEAHGDMPLPLPMPMRLLHARRRAC